MKNKILGFTLVELLIVISIIGILMAISYFSLQGTRESARDAKRKGDLELIRASLEIYKADCGLYPLAGSTYPRTYGPPSSAWPSTLFGNGLTPACLSTNPYLSPPSDPTTGNYYRYYSVNGTSYDLCSTLEGVSGSPLSCGGTGCGATAICEYRVSNP